jgi:c-di-GMP-binding flagellar brake protein YcgR
VRSACFYSPSPIDLTVGDVIFMTDRMSDRASQKVNQRDRRYAIRYPFAADAEVLDLESGTRCDGVTSDISLGGCFVCTSKPLPVKSRTRVTLVRKEESVEALAMVRIVKPRIGMGLEFIDVEPATTAILNRWLDQLRRDR